MICLQLIRGLIREQRFPRLEILIRVKIHPSNILDRNWTDKYPACGREGKRNYRALTKRGRARGRGPVRLSINYTVIGYRGARLCGWTAPITSPWPGQRGLLPSPPLPRAQSHGTSLEGFECHSTIIIAARVMYHVIVHGDSAFAWTEEEDATFRYPDPGLVHLSLFVPGQRQPYHIRFCCDGKSARASSPSLGRRKLRKFRLEDRFLARDSIQLERRKSESERSCPVFDSASFELRTWKSWYAVKGSSALLVRRIR